MSRQKEARLRNKERLRVFVQLPAVTVAWYSSSTVSEEILVFVWGIMGSTGCSLHKL